MIESSTGLANGMMVDGSFISLMNLCSLKIYTTPVPDTADDAVTGTLLLTITNNGGATGLTWESTASNRTAAKKSTETWSGTVVANGTAAYFRLVAAGDTGDSSDTAKRIQGTVGNTATSDLFFTTPTLVLSDVKTIAAFNVELPTNP